MLLPVHHYVLCHLLLFSVPHKLCGEAPLSANFDRQPFTGPPMTTPASRFRKEFSVSRIHLHSNWQGFGLRVFCFMLWCLFKLTVSSVVLFWPRVTFSSGDLLWAGTNCIITKVMAVNMLLQENIRISFMHKLIDLCTLILLRWQPYLLLLIVEWKSLYKNVRLLRAEYLMWVL